MLKSIIITKHQLVRGEIHIFHKARYSDDLKTTHTIVNGILHVTEVQNDINITHIIMSHSYVMR